MRGQPSNNFDTQNMIEYCLNCPWDKCWNCLEGHGAYSYGLRADLIDNEKGVEEVRQIWTNARLLRGSRRSFRE